ncbi:MAG: hypothetical protein ACLR17_06630 [Enterobacteriaceae bacterium]
MGSEEKSTATRRAARTQSHEELHKADLYNKVSQAFTVFCRSVPLASGDGRKYDWVVPCAVETIDLATAHWAHLPYDFLGRVSNRIINEVNGISCGVRHQR